MPDPVRDEAERLVAAAVAAFSMAARGLGAATGNRPFATGSPECCVCPVCRVIAAVRDPDADLAERLATGAGDLATGVASLLRSLSGGRSGDTDSRNSDPGPGDGDAFWESLRRRARGAAGGEDDTWHRATNATPGTATAGPGPTSPPARPMAKKVAKKAVRKAAPLAPEDAPLAAPPTGPGRAGSGAPGVGADDVGADDVAPGDTLPVPPEAQPPARKVAKKAVKRTPPPSEEA